MRLFVSVLVTLLSLWGGKGIYHKGTLEEKSCQLATLYGCGRVLPDPLPVEGWKQEVWSQGIANIDEQLNGVGKAYREHYDLIYPFPNHVKALHETQRWFVEQTRLGIPVEFSNEGIHGLNHTNGGGPLPRIRTRRADG